jgi:hypothetical protein
MTTSRSSALVVLTVLVAALGTAGHVMGIMRQNRASERFEYTVIDSAGPVDPWGKSVGDINGDGLPDLIVGGHSGFSPQRVSIYRRVLRKLHIWRPIEPRTGQLVWYENPSWRKHVISDKDCFTTDHEVADIDRDGANDAVSLTDSALVWFRNPDLSRTIIDNRVLHDIEVADLDNDGDVDIVSRNQSSFNHNDGDLDIISIGWGHDRVLLYENQNLAGRCPGIIQCFGLGTDSLSMPSREQ